MKNKLAFIGDMILLSIVFAMFWVALVIGSAWEADVRCKNGAMMYCQGGSNGEIYE